MSDLILFNANVITMDPAMPRASAVAVRDGLIVEVSPDGLISVSLKDPMHIDCAGRTVLPGFIDAHCHIASYAESLITLDLSGKEEIASISDIQARLRDLASETPPGAWLRGKRYNEFHLAEKRHPTRWDLDAAAPFHPVKLTHRSGHAHVLNSLGLKLTGITAETGDPPDGLIERDLKTGEPNGLLFGMAGYLSQRIPPMAEEDIERGLALASEKLLSYGITSVQDASSHNGLRQWGRFADWKSRNLFGPGVTMMMGVEGFNELKSCPEEIPRSLENGLRMGGVKIIVDQITGSLQPDREELNAVVDAVHASGMQVVIHAIEEKIIDAACDAIQLALEKMPRSDHRHRIEHCSVCSPPLLKRIRHLGIFVVTQPPFIYYSGDRYLETVPFPENQWLYRIGTMVGNGVKVIGSSDVPVADPNPLLGIYAAVTRKTQSGRLFLPDEGTQVLRALEMYTTSAARAGREEDCKGSVTTGRVADLVVLSGDPISVKPDELKTISVCMTIMGGRVVWVRGVWV
jgi:predicted amidohydrolase YtcJ